MVTSNRYSGHPDQPGNKHPCLAPGQLTSRVFRFAPRWSRQSVRTGALIAVHFLLGCCMLNAADEKTQSAQTAKRKLAATFVDELIAIKPGSQKYPKSFQMGSEKGEPSERPVHSVKLSKPFRMARYEVPQNLYEAVMGSNPSRWKGPRNSAEMMTWHEAVTFCQRLTELLRDEKLIEQDEVVRLPTEAEWEYCCRAGTTTAYSFGEEAQAAGDEGKQASKLDPYAWHTGNAAGNDPPVGALKPNPWGLYDMHGYLSEFVADGWTEDYSKAAAETADTIVAADAEACVLRGGSWRDTYRGLRSAARTRFGKQDRNDAVGFRCVVSRPLEGSDNASR